MQIDLNSPDGLTLEAVRQLLASASDDVHNQLRVTKDGISETLVRKAAVIFDAPRRLGVRKRMKNS